MISRFRGEMSARKAGHWAGHCASGTLRSHLTVFGVSAYFFFEKEKDKLSSETRMSKEQTFPSHVSVRKIRSGWDKL